MSSLTPAQEAQFAEFLRKLRETPRDWLMAPSGCLYRPVNGVRRCPICAVAGGWGLCWWLAYREAGVSKQLASVIALAAWRLDFSAEFLGKACRQAVFGATAREVIDKGIKEFNRDADA